MPITRRCLGLLALFAAVLPAYAAVTLNLKDADINTLITTVSEVTGKNFIVDDKIKGKVTVISSSPMSADAVYETFLAVLQVKGFAAVPAGDVIKIVPEVSARTDGGSPMSSGVGRPDDDVVTHVYEVQNGSAQQLVPLLRQLVPQWAHLAAYAPSNMLIISDRAANVQRIEKIIQKLDQSGDREIELVRLQHAAASEVVRILTTLAQQDKQADASVKPATIIADERSNAVLIGGDKAARQKLLDIIAHLDVPLAEDGATQVVYLRYASAENLAPILEGYAQHQQATEGKPAAQGAAAVGGDGRARILADKEANALVITAPPKTMRAIRNVIEQLDIQRAQVLVEAVIAEVSADKQSQLGVDWAVFNEDRIAAANILNSGTLGLAGAAISGSSTAIAGAINNLGTGAVAAGGRINKDGTSFGLLLRALQGDGDTNILSTPTLVTMDNEEAKFAAGQEVPFLTGRFTQTGTTTGTAGVVNPFQTIERKDVGLTLGITPQINEGNNIKLKVNLEISSLLAGGVAGASDLVTTKRTLTNTVNVESGQILVIGGLIDDTLTENESGVPFLSKIPLIGALFKSKSVKKLKRNLMVFIRPAILRGIADADYYTRRKYDSVRDDQIRANRVAPLTGGTRPRLPEYEQFCIGPTEQASAKPAALHSAPSPQVAPAPQAPAAEAPRETPAESPAAEEPAAESPAPAPAPEEALAP
ncbi:MAG: type II secretion system secretin GspD [Gammaproteobacteria bacterium]|nr:type II secretion system secretin GspD [Gammaproteobacteria bacterium]